MSDIKHVAIIMDGNGRWAEQHGLPKVAGHRQGAKQVSAALETARELGIKYLTLYAFSTENWKRPLTEVNALMGLLEEFLAEKLPELMEKNVCLRTIGRTDGLPYPTRKALLSAIAKTAKNNDGVLTLALNYGGRSEIVDAVNKITEAGVKVTEETFRNYLYAPDMPDPDLLIRTSGELRLSNFLLWQLSYSEIYVTDVLWPDFGRDDFIKAVDSFRQRDRRFGGRKK